MILEWLAIPSLVLLVLLSAYCMEFTDDHPDLINKEAHDGDAHHRP